VARKNCDKLIAPHPLVIVRSYLKLIYINEFVSLTDIKRS
jgi:hypothetical protein